MLSFESFTLLQSYRSLVYYANVVTEYVLFIDTDMRLYVEKQT